MKKIIHLVVIGALCFTLAGCGNDAKIDPVEIGEKSNYVIEDHLLSMTVEDESISHSKATLVLENKTNKTYLYGAAYLIEYEKNGVWYEITPINDMVFDLIAYILAPNETKKFEIDWEYHYGKLPSGKYRIIKSVFLEKDSPIKESDYIYLSAEFIIK